MWLPDEKFILLECKIPLEGWVIYIYILNKKPVQMSTRTSAVQTEFEVSA